MFLANTLIMFYPNYVNNHASWMMLSSAAAAAASAKSTCFGGAGSGYIASSKKIQNNKIHYKMLKTYFEKYSKLSILILIWNFLFLKSTSRMSKLACAMTDMFRIWTRYIQFWRQLSKNKTKSNFHSKKQKYCVLNCSNCNIYF